MPVTTSQLTTPFLTGDVQLPTPVNGIESDTNDQSNIALTETWNRLDWSNFDTDQAQTNAQGLGRVGQSTYPFGLSTQSHIDIRTFTNVSWVASAGSTITTGNLPLYNNLPGATLSLVSGTNTFTDTDNEPVDLTQIGTDGSLILTAPGLPTGSVVLSSSYLDLSSDGFGNNTCSLQLSTSSPAWSSGNQVFTFPWSALGGFDQTNLTDVRLRIQATGTAFAYVTALRMVGPDWVPTNVDFDNRDGYLRPGIQANGAEIGTPWPSNQIIPTLWRSALVPSVNDPAPIDSEFEVMFYTGTSTNINSFTLYLRQISQAFITQIDLQGTTQAQLTGQPQPTEGVSEYSPRTMGDLDRYTMGQLDAETMIDLERTNNPVYESWISFSLQWGSVSSLQITNSANPTGGYSFSSGLTLQPKTQYVAIFNVTDTNVRAQIYNVSGGLFMGLLLLDYATTSYSLGNLIFDTQVIPDGFMFPRRSGRVGFQASLGDGDSYVRDIRPRTLNFAQYISKPLQSFTPVKGAHLYVQNSPDTQLFTDETTLVAIADSNGDTPLLVSDASRYSSGDNDNSSIRVQMTTPGVGQGVATPLLTPMGDPYSGITDFANLEINMSIWLPSAAIPPADLESVGSVNITTTPMIQAALVSPNNAFYLLNLPPIIPDQWANISLKQPLSYPWPLSGPYALHVWYAGPYTATWWIDAIDIFEKSVIWDARSVTSDPWNSNYAPWTPFHDALNSAYDGAYFSMVGNNLQVRATALKQNSAIVGSPNIVPQYATLGKLVWPEDYNVTGSISPGTINVVRTNRNYVFTSNASSTNGSGNIGNYYWSFGDGSYAATGPTVSHTYSSSVLTGTQYTVTLTVMDTAGILSAVPGYTAIMS